MLKYVVVTGAGTGIGYALAEALHERGYTVIGISPCFDMCNMKPLEKRIGLIPIECDISDLVQVKNAAVQVNHITGGRVHVLYNNAGICPLGGPLIDSNDQHLKKIFDVNVLGHMYMTKYFSQMVIDARGIIVFTSSVAARVPLSWTGAYCATKAALDQYALVLRGEMRPLGVRVHSVVTGGVDTAILDHVADRKWLKYFATKEVDDSVYAALEGSRNPRTRVSPQKYANDVCDKVGCWRDCGFHIFSGYGAYLLHLLRLCTPIWLVEYSIQWYFKQDVAFDAIKRLRQQNEAESEGQ